jgi:CBS domain-containing protein
LIDTLKEFSQLQISSIIKTERSIFNPNDPLSKAIGYLKDTGKYELVAASRNKLGIITVRDLLEIEQPQRTKIDSIWTQIRAARQNDSIIMISESMLNNGIRALPVIKNNNVIGMISQIDIISEMSNVRELENFEAKKIMKTPVITMDHEEGIVQARRKMLDERISHIPITKNNKLIGIVTAEQIVHKFISPASKTTRGDRVGEKISRFPGKLNALMDSEPCTENLNVRIIDVAKSFLESGKSACLLVDEERRIFGIITPKEMLSFITTIKPEQELPVYIIGITDENFFEQSIAEEKIRRIITKSIKTHHDITEVRINVKKQNLGGERKQYQLIARILGPSNSYQIKHEGWGLTETFDGLCNTIDKTLRRAKKEPQKGSRRGRKRPNPYFKT